MGMMSFKNQEAMIRSQIKARLANLPAPENDVEIALPEMPDDIIMGEDDLELDAADIERIKQEEIEKQRKIEYERRSQTLKKNLPRVLLPELAQWSDPVLPTAELQESEKLLWDGVKQMLIRDASIEPPEYMGKIVAPPDKKKVKTAYEFLHAQDDEVKEASLLIEQEAMMQFAK